MSDVDWMNPGVCLKNHFHNVYAPLCGALCTVSDVVVKRFPLHKPQLHDILVFERVGAYSVTEGIYLFLSRPLPRIYFWTEGEGLRMVRDGVHTDLLNSEK